MKTTSNLDKLEKDLGLDTIDDPFGWTVTAAPVTGIPTWTTVGDIPVESARKKGAGSEGSGDESGLIPVNWIAGNFVGSLEPSLSLLLYDWAIISDEKYAGIYLIVSLLEIFSDILLTMNHIQIKAWFHAVAVGKKDWYRLLPSNTIHSVLPSSEVDNSGDHQWKAFMVGWIKATSTLRQRTPHAFQSAVNLTEEWCVVTSDRMLNQQPSIEDSAPDPDDTFLDGPEVEQHGTSGLVSVMEYTIEDEDDDNDEDVFSSNAANITESSSIAGSAPKSTINLMDKFNKLRKTFQRESIAVDELKLPSSSEGTAKVYQQDYPFPRISLWSDPQRSCFVFNF